MLDLMVKMYECPLDFAQPLKSSLQRLSDVVCLQQGHIGRQHDVNLDEEVVAEVERAHGVDVRHLRVVIDGDPR